MSFIEQTPERGVMIVGQPHVDLRITHVMTEILAVGREHELIIPTVIPTVDNLRGESTRINNTIAQKVATAPPQHMGKHKPRKKFTIGSYKKH